MLYQYDFSNYKYLTNIEADKIPLKMREEMLSLINRGLSNPEIRKEMNLPNTRAVYDVLRHMRHKLKNNIKKDDIMSTFTEEDIHLLDMA